MTAQSSKLKAQSKLLIALFIFIVLSAFSFQLSAATDEPVSSKELIDNAKEFDGKTITYKGEVVTAILGRGKHSWVNLNDGDNAIGVWCESAALKPVKFLGDYKNKGDILEIEGVFHRACPVHGGELDIHAENIRIVSSGYAVGERLDWMRLRLSLAVFLAAFLVLIIFRKRL